MYWAIMMLYISHMSGFKSILKYSVKKLEVDMIQTQVTSMAWQSHKPQWQETRFRLRWETWSGKASPERWLLN